MTLPELIDKLHDEDACYRYLEYIRWPQGVTCLACSSEKISRINRNLKRHGGADYNRTVFECSECGLQFTATCGTIFHDTHLPLRKWFLAIHRIGESKKGVSALQLQRELGIGSYRTAWYMCHRIREAMKQAGSPALKGIIEADETYVKGAGLPRGEKLKHGRGSQRHTPVAGAKERGGKIAAKVVANVKHATLHMFLEEVIGPEAEALYTDELSSYNNMGLTPRHEVVVHSDWYVREDVHTNNVESFWSLFKRGIVGSYHHVSPKHLQRYVDEYCWRSNNREGKGLFSAIVGEAVQTKNLTYERLIS